MIQKGFSLDDTLDDWTIHQKISSNRKALGDKGLDDMDDMDDISPTSRKSNKPDREVWE